MSIQHKQVSTGLPIDLGDRMIRYIASTEEEDRDGDILRAAGCDFKNFARNPQFLGFHNYQDFPLGVPKNWGIDHAGKKVYIDVYFPTVEELSSDPLQASEKAKLVDFTYNCYKTGMLKAVSVGFKIKDAEPNRDAKTPWGQIIKAWEIIELSAVPVPANASALAESIKSYDPSGKLLDIFEAKSAIPYHKYPHAGDDVKWNGPEEVAKANVEDLAKMCAWKADKKPEDMTKGDYKLPHHTVDGYKTVRAGVVAAGNAIMGARGGVDIPVGDVESVKSHLEKHYHEFDMKAPWEEKTAGEYQTKSGRRISAATMKIIEDMKSCHERIKECHKEFDDLMTRLINGTDDDEGNDEPEEPVLEIDD